MQSMTSMQSMPSTTRAVIAANGAIALIVVARSLLARQLAAQAAAFSRDGGFSERLYRHRRGRR